MHYFQGKYWAKNWSLREKSHCSQSQLSPGVGFIEVGYEEFTVRENIELQINI